MRKDDSTMLLSAWLVLLLAVAAWRDIATRSIPDTASLLLALFGLTSNLILEPSRVVFSLMAAVALFAVLLFLFARSALGGGDVKLMTALALGMSAPEIWNFVVATAMVGGVLGLLYLLLSWLLPAHLARPAQAAGVLPRLFHVEAWRIRRRGPLPYGIAIAVGGAMILLQRA
jgi:prepilin peptidase CpaA